MAYNILKTTRDLLISDSDITNIVPDANIRVGWSNILTAFPSITITLVSDRDVGWIGYGISPDGSRLHRSDIILQIDILSKESITQISNIGDNVTSLLMKNGYVKISEGDSFEDNIKAYRKSIRFSYTSIEYR